MQIKISARHGHLSPVTQERITEKVEKICRLFDRISSIQVTVDLEHKDSVHVELCASVEHSDNFVATNKADDLMVAVDHVVHKVEQQLRKHKERVQDSHRTSGRKQREMPEIPEPSEE